MADFDINDFRCLTDAEANDLVGKSILIGVTYISAEGEELQRAQMHGVVSSATSRGVEVALRGAREGSTFSLPPDPRFFTVGKVGKYTLRSTGEVVVNPQILCTAVIKAQRTN